MVLFAAVTLLCAVVAWEFWTQRQARQALRDAQLPAGELVSIDTQRVNLETLKQQKLFSARYGLSGRLDRIMRTPRGIVPVELKSSRALRTGPHEAQLASCLHTAYCSKSIIKARCERASLNIRIERLRSRLTISGASGLWI